MRFYYGEVYRDDQLVATTSFYSKTSSVERAVDNLKSIFQEPEEVLQTRILKSEKQKAKKQ